jgi:hypothetical protein
MKEKRYKEVTGLVDKNTFHQFDQWENQALHGAKNRFVYDFSLPIVPGKTAQESFTELGAFSRKTSSSNLYPFFDRQFTYYGFPGDECQILLDNGQYFTNGYTNFENTINADEATPTFNENALGYVDAATPRLFAFQLDNWASFFRSGYVEFAIKTNKRNSIIASGTSEVDAASFNFLGWLFGNNMSSGADRTALAIDDTASSEHIVSNDSPFYSASSFDGALININIEINNDGKIRINYYDDYNRDNVNFIFDGNTNIADNNWHHIVINFGRPGLIKQNGTKFNKKFVEIWVDGQLDKRFDDKVNDYQIFYPTIKWLFNNVSESLKNVLEYDIDVENDFDYHPKGSGSGLNSFIDRYTGISELLGGQDIFEYCVANTQNKQKAFSGAMHLFAHGLNIPLSQYEIKRRHRLWKKETRKYAKIINVNAEMKDPVVSTNSKKALKLYWNEIVTNGKNGLSLDKNYQVESYSVTHQSNDSKTEIFNIDKIIQKEVNILKNVRAAFTDNVVILGPGMVYSPNLSESYYGQATTLQRSAAQFNPKDNRFLDSVKPDYEPEQMWFGPRSDIFMSGINLVQGDRILLTNQIRTEENGIWIFNGLDKYLTRDTDSLIIDNSKIHVVYVTDGYEANTYWRLSKTFTSLSDPQKWTLVDGYDINNLNSIPTHTTRWKDYYGEDRLINLQDDLDISRYDLIVFMNYPESNDQIFDAFPNDPKAQVLKQYNDFIQSLKVACSNGASLYVSSPKLAEDMGIVSNFIAIDQEIEIGDGRSAVINPFQFDEPADSYFDTHRQNAYHLDTEIPGLTDRETWIMTEAINYIPKDEYDYEQWHLKYSYRQFGLQEGNEFLIPSLAIRQVATKNDLPGFRANSRASSKLYVANPVDVQAGVIVTSLANTHYHGATIANNEYDDYATSIAIFGGEQLSGMPINGKIFVNCVEDGYTMSREEYNKGIIQVIPNNDPNETNARRQWQYSTSRLNRSPKRVNVRELTTFGQTTPTNGGGGPIVQSATNSSNGIIRSETDKNNKDYQSDLYPQETEEIYPVQEIPVLSMTWLGLKWLEG